MATFWRGSGTMARGGAHGHAPSLTVMPPVFSRADFESQEIGSLDTLLGSTYLLS
jgi:hypothetical protein